VFRSLTPPLSQFNKKIIQDKDVTEKEPASFFKAKVKRDMKNTAISA